MLGGKCVCWQKVMKAATLEEQTSQNMIGEIALGHSWTGEKNVVGRCRFSGRKDKRKERRERVWM